jgi:hypothetical protein
MHTDIGILAFGSLIDDPGAEIEAAIVSRKANIQTPFGVEFARKSIKRGNAPTLVPMLEGGTPVPATILLVSLTEQDAKDCLWRREVNRVGQGGRYIPTKTPGPNTLIIDRHVDLGGVPVVLSARFPATIEPLTAERLAELALESALVERTGRDGITYLMDAKRNGLITPLSPAYEMEILRKTGASDLVAALRGLQNQEKM